MSYAIRLREDLRQQRADARFTVHPAVAIEVLTALQQDVPHAAAIHLILMSSKQTQSQGALLQ